MLMKLVLKLSPEEKGMTKKKYFSPFIVYNYALFPAVSERE